MFQTKNVLTISLAMMGPASCLSGGVTRITTVLTSRMRQTAVCIVVCQLVFCFKIFHLYL